MGYYVRVFGKQDTDVPASVIKNYLAKYGLVVDVSIEKGTDYYWQVITIFDVKGAAITQIERKSIADEKSSGREELQEFNEDIESEEPASAVQWIKQFFNEVSVIYVFEIFDFLDDDNGWRIIDEIKILLVYITNGIVHAQHEGFTNHEGYLILWQFFDAVEGHWPMAVLDQNNQWIRFNMELSNEHHREIFRKGLLPPDITPVKH